jgi:hypothetical protein
MSRNGSSILIAPGQKRKFTIQEFKAKRAKEKFRGAFAAQVREELEGNHSARAGEQLPPPPGGFTRQHFKEIKAHFLKPTGWFIKHERKDDTEAFFLTKENIAQDRFFTTGLTLNCLRDLRKRTGKTPSADAAALAEQAASDYLLTERSSSQQGPFKIVKFRYDFLPPTQMKITIQQVLVANDATSTLYLLTFEATKASWAEEWKIGELMLDQMNLDKKF